MRSQAHGDFLSFMSSFRKNDVTSASQIAESVTKMFLSDPAQLDCYAKSCQILNAQGAMRRLLAKWLTLRYCNCPHLGHAAHLYGAPKGHRG